MGDLVHIKRSANVLGVPASLILRPVRHGPADDFRTVASAADVDREIRHPAKLNHCPLCDGVFGPEAFWRHAQTCLNAYAPAWERQQEDEPIYHGDAGVKSTYDGKPRRFRGVVFGGAG